MKSNIVTVRFIELCQNASSAFNTKQQSAVGKTSEYEMCFIPLSQRLYKEKGVNDQHNYTITAERPEIMQAKINAANFSEVILVHAAYAPSFLFYTQWVSYFKVIIIWYVFLFQIKYKESWHTLRAQGYKLTMQDIPFQAAKSSTGIASDVRSYQTQKHYG